ncbi:MAG: tetratricopeptide repeat protein [Polyangiaceae bacterium]|nr:tetratricopeptide repeat protein [Polyangiaceae bacterium]
MQTSLDEAAELLRHAEELASNGRPEAATAIALTIAERTGEPGHDAGAETRAGESLGLLLLRLGALFRKLGAAERAVLFLGRAQKRFDNPSSIENVARLAEARRERGLALRDLGRLGEAEAELRDALDGDLSYAEVPSIVGSLRDLALVLAAIGKYTSAAKCYEWAVQQAMALEDRDLEAIVRHGYGELLLEAGRADIAFLRFWRAFNIFRQLGDDDGLACSARGLGDVALAGGRGAEARESFLQMLALGQQNGRPSIEAYALIRRAAGYRTDGFLEDAERELRTALSILEAHETDASEMPQRLAAFVPAPVDLLSECVHTLGFTLLGQGRHREAEDLAHRALQTRTRRKDKALWKTCALLAEIAAAQGETVLARSWHERAAQSFRAPPILAQPAADVEQIVDGLRPLLAMAQSARRGVDVWVGPAFSFGGAVPCEAELREHLARLAERDSAAPIPSKDLMPAIAAALRHAWKLGPWPEDDLIPERDD